MSKRWNCSSKHFLYLFLSGIMLCLSACTDEYLPAVYSQTKHETSAVYDRMESYKNKAIVRQTSVIDKHGAYVDTTPIAFVNKPIWANKVVILRGQNMPFNDLVKRIIDPVGATTTFDKGIDPATLVSMNYSGTIGGALNQLATKTGYAYTFNNNVIQWSGLQSRTFDISFMPGATSYLVGKEQQGSGASSNNSGLTGYSQNNTDVQDNEYSNLTATLSLWDDLRKTLDQLKSTMGKVEVSQATTSVTVTDKPENVSAMAHYIDQLNNSLSQEVMIQVQVLEVELKDDFSYGIDWNLIEGQFKMTGDVSSPINFTPIGGNNPGTVGLGVGILNGGTSVKALLKFLQQQGNLSTETYPRVMTMNNQIAEIGINTQTAYVQQSSTTATQQSTTTTVTPGVVSEGFTLYVLPKIQSPNIYMQISSTLARLLGIQTVRAGGDNAGNNTVQIQLPQVAYKRFNQRSVVPTGSTLVLAGFKQIHNENNRTGYLGSWALGSKGASHGNVETIVLITPTIIGKTS